MKGYKARHVNNILLAVTALLLTLVCISIVVDSSKSEKKRITEKAIMEGRHPGLTIGNLTTPNDNAGNRE